MADVAVGVTIFKRIEKLDTLLESIDPGLISTVYVADDGERTDRKEEMYAQSFPFELEVFDLEFDAGLGAGRDKIVRALDEDYLLLMDCDMKMPKNTDVLIEQLRADPELGGVCGLFAEEDRIFTSGCIDIYEEENKCKLELRDRKTVEYLAGYPFVEFDMIANGALFRRECLEDYSWDPEYVIGREHVDFYVGHKRRTDWNFGLSPGVLFPHDPGGSESYVSNRWNDGKYETAERYFLDKWGYAELDPIGHTWLETYDPTFGGYRPFSHYQWAKYRYRNDGPLKLALAGMRLLGRKTVGAFS